MENYNYIQKLTYKNYNTIQNKVLHGFTTFHAKQNFSFDAKQNSFYSTPYNANLTEENKRVGSLLV